MLIPIESRSHPIQLRPYQSQSDTDIDDAYAAGHRNVLFVLPCRGGKTPIVANRINKHQGASVAIAHRQELVGQMSRTLARWEIRHRIIGPQNVIKAIIQSQIQMFGRDYYDPSARCAVAGVDTLISPRRVDELKRWAEQVTLWVTDEAHHIIGDNKWGRAVGMFPNALGLGVTATPERADGKGLGRHADGVFDCMVEGPGMRQLINGLPDWNGVATPYMADYRVFCPPSDLDLTAVPIGADGDYVRGQLALKTRSSTIMGHVVEHYLRIAPGKLGITFAPDVETATEFSKLFNQAGVRAEVVTAKTPDRMRIEIMKRFERREVLQLVNVDLFGEGVDVPAMEVCTMARATQSYALFIQQFCRPCTVQDGKLAIIIDHVGNVVRHGLPDRPRVWTLDRRERRAASADPSVIPLRNCLNPDCLAPYERVLVACPFCGMVPVPAGRTAPELVDGDLCELDAATLAALRGEVSRVDRSPDAVRHALERAGQPAVVCHSAAKQQVIRQQAQGCLRSVMELWMGHQKARGRGVREAQRRFFHRFGVDVLTAQAAGRAEVEGLIGRVAEDTMKGPQ